jgi:hypothetical protein
VSWEHDKVVAHGLTLFAQAQAMPKGPERAVKIGRAADFLRRAGDRRRPGVGIPPDAVNFYVLADLVAADEGMFRNIGGEDARALRRKAGLR